MHSIHVKRNQFRKIYELKVNDYDKIFRVISDKKFIISGSLDKTI